MSFRLSLQPVLPILLATLFSFSATANNNSSTGQGLDTIILEDVSDVSTAVAELTSELEQQGFTIPLTVNHSAAAARVDLELAPNQVIFARPPKFVESKLLQGSNTLGLDLPFKLLVFKNSDGTVSLSVNSLGYLVDRHSTHAKDFVKNLTHNLTSHMETMGNEKQGLVSVKSSLSVDDSIETLENAISANPAVSIPLIVDYAKNTDDENSILASKLLVFGNPNVGTPLMQADPRIGIDLPLKFLVWEDQEGQVTITYNDPHFIAKRVDLQGQDARLEKIAKVLKKLSLAGSGGKPKK